jgi:hypothetical protein
VALDRPAASIPQWAVAVGGAGCDRTVDGTVSVHGTLGYVDDEWNLTPKDTRIHKHTFFPIDWTEADIRQAGQQIFDNGTKRHGGTMVIGNYRGVDMVGYLKDGVPTSFFPTGG